MPTQLSCIPNGPLCGRLVSLLTAAALVPCTVFAQQQAVPSVGGPTGVPQGSFLYANFCRAQDALQAAVEAHGGKRSIEDRVSVRARFEGHFYHQAHNERPWAHRDYAIEGQLLFSAPLHALLREQTYDYAGPQSSFTLLTADRGLYLSASWEDAREIEPSEVAERWRDELEVLPQELVRQALHSAESLRWLGADEHGDVVQYQVQDGPLRALFFDRDTHLLRRMEHLGHWKLKGDRVEWTDFSQYKTLNGLPVAHSVRSHWEHRDTQTDEHLILVDVEVGGSIGAEALAVPVAHAEAHAPFAFEAQVARAKEVLPSHALGNGVYILDLAEANARAMLVEFADFCVVIEGGDHSALAERVLDTAERLFPNKPVRYVAMSHHHPLYTGGIRSYVQRGVTVLSTPGNVDYIGDLAARPYRIQPDAQQEQPATPVFEIIDKVKIIEDSTQRLEFHNFDTSLHTDEYVLTFVPSLKLGFLGDLIFSPNEGTVGPGHGRTEAIYELIEGLGLPIETLSQTCNLTRGKMLYPYAEIVDCATATTGSD